MFPFKKFKVTVCTHEETVVFEHTCWALNEINAVLKTGKRMKEPVGYLFSTERIK